MFYLAGAAASSALDLLSSLQQALGGSGAGAQSSNPFDAGATTSATASSTTTSGTASASAPTSPLSSSTLNALFSLQGQNGTQGASQQPLLLVNGNALSQDIFSMLDTNGDGQISQSEFDKAFGQNGNTTQANNLFNQISGGGSSINLQQLTNALEGQDQSGTPSATQGSDTQGMGHHHHGGGFDIASLLGGAADSGASGAGAGTNSNTSGDTTQTVTNADGSTTTTITYADGSTVSMTTAAASSSSPSSSSSSSSNSNSGAGSVTSLNNIIEQMIQRQAQMLTASSSVGQSVAVSA